MGLDRKKPLPKRPRLRSFPYLGHYAYTVTLLTRERQPLLNDGKTVNHLLTMLKEVSAQKRFIIEAYCFLPDHLHLLVVGNSHDSDLRRFIALFKQKTGYWFKQEYGIPLWHISYYDHILRKEEDKMAVVRYILENPVRRGLVGDFRTYPFSGSFVFDLKAL